MKIEEKELRTDGTNKKQQYSDLNPTPSLIMLIVNGLNTPINRQISYSELTKSIQPYMLYTRRTL